MKLGLVNNNSLTDIAGKFISEFWTETLAEIQRSRKMEKEESPEIRRQ